MKTLHYSIIAMLGFVMIASTNLAFAIDNPIPQVNLNMTYKISYNYGAMDWSPTSNILVVADNDTLLQFAVNGTKIAFLNSNGPFNIPADVDVLDLRTRQLTQLTHVSHVFYYAWTPDDNIIYSTIQSDSSFKIYALDVKNNSTSQIMTSYNLHGLDVSPDGKKLVISQNYTSNNCSRSYYSQCYDHLFVYDLGSNKNSYTEIAQTDTYKGDPRWSHDGSFIIYTTGTGGCTTIGATTPDGKNDVSFIYRQSMDMGCYSLAVTNTENTIIAYQMNYGAAEYNDKFNPLNGGLYFTFTNLCDISCTHPVNSIPILDPVETSRDIYLGPGKGLTTYDDHGDSTEQGETFSFDNKTLSLVLENQGKPRYLKVFFPTAELNGNLTVLINGKEFYPKMPDECGNLMVSPFSKCQGAAGVENFGDWTMAIATDNDTLHDISTIKIIGTNTIPEFPLVTVVLLVSITSVIAIYRIRFRK